MEKDYYSRTRSEMVPFIPKDRKRVLEIGCGTGEFGQILKSLYDFHYTGLELNNDSAIIAKDRLDVVHSGNAFDIFNNLPDKQFDLLICNDVIEHIINPGDFLDIIRSKLTDDAVLVFSIPNFRFIGNLIHILFNKDFEYSDYGIRDKTHLTFFTKKSIIRFFSSKNFVIDEIKGINPVMTYKMRILLFFLKLAGHGDIRYFQFAVIAHL